MSEERHPPEAIARFFHEEYERMASSFSYETRRESAVPWEQLMESNKNLMIAVVTSVMIKFFPDRLSIPFMKETNDNGPDNRPGAGTDPAED